MSSHPGTLSDISGPKNVQSGKDGAVDPAKDAEEGKDCEFPVMVGLCVGHGELVISYCQSTRPWRRKTRRGYESWKVEKGDIQARWSHSRTGSGRGG